MSNELSIRNATKIDLAFLVDSNAAMALETEGKNLDRAVLERGVSAVFERTERGLYLIAEQASRSVGCLLITYEWSDWRNGDWWWLQSVYIIPSVRRSGVFRAMYAEVARRAAAAANVAGLRLYVDAENVRAQETYATLGMVHARYELFECEWGGEEPAPARASQ